MTSKQTHSHYPLRLIGFYTPHAPVSFDGSIVDPFTGQVSTPPSRTKQEFKDQCNINNIIKEFTITGRLNHISAKAAQGAFLDLPGGIDYQESLHIIQRAEEAFMALPAATRDRFDNDPAAFLSFVSDPKNGDELIELGIRERPKRTAEQSAPQLGGAGELTPAPSPAPAPGSAAPAAAAPKTT